MAGDGRGDRHPRGAPRRRFGADVVEVGPGPGFTTDVLRTRVAQLTAVELDPELAGALARRLEGTNVEVIRGDATALDLPSDRFTGAVSFNMLHHVPTAEGQDRIFAELALCCEWMVSSWRPTALPSDDLSGFHAGDTYNPINFTDLPVRLAVVGFTEITVWDVRPRLDLHRPRGLTPLAR